MDRIDAQNDPKAQEAAAKAVRKGGLVAFGTETVYGLGADATNSQAVARIYEAKGRPRFNPLICHVPNVEAAHAIGVFSPLAEELAAAFWPGPFTMVLPKRPEAGLSDLVTAGLDTVAIRVPGHESARAFLAKAGTPVAAPSANPSGKVSPTTAAHVAEGLGNKIDMLLDGGPCTHGLESTIVAVDENTVTLLRPGSITGEMIAGIIGSPPVHPEEHKQDAPVAPGMLKSHYAPDKPIRLNATSFADDEAVLSFGPVHHSGPVYPLSTSADLTEAATNLFATLRAADASTAHRIAVMPIPEDGLGYAINDRLARAAAPKDAVHEQ